MAGGRDIFGNLANTDVHGNPADQNIMGERPKDAAGNTHKDIFGNETSDEETEKPSE
jgi:hypothetical protein